MKEMTLLTVEELGERIHYNPRYIMRKLVDCKLQEGVHYVRPFGGKKLLFVWERILSDLMSSAKINPAEYLEVAHG